MLGATALRRGHRHDRGTERDDAEATPDLTVVAHQRRQMSTYALGGISLLIIVTAFVATVFVRVRLAEGQRRIDDLGELIIEAEAVEEDLQLEIAQLEAPERIWAAASRLLMIAPNDVVYLAPVLADDPKTRLPAPVGDPFAPAPDEGEGDAGSDPAQSTEEGG